MNLIESYFYAIDDTKIFYRRDIPSSSTCIVIIAHGYMEHSGRYIDFAEKLVANNIGVCIIDHRGNGRSEGEEGDVEDFFSFVTDIKALTTALSKYNKKIMTFGHSMGGLITFLYGLKYPGDVIGQIFSSPALGVPLGCKFLPQSLYEHLGQIPGAKIYRMGQELAVRNKMFLEKFKDDIDCNEYATGRFMDQFLRVGMQYAIVNASQYRVKSLFLLGDADHVIPIDRNQSILTKITKADKKVVVYEGCMHDLLHDLDENIECVTEDTLKWLLDVVESINN
ncbi:MAG: alpha/beta hydrolase [Cellulosilyticaceae bacterium]